MSNTFINSSIFTDEQIKRARYEEIKMEKSYFSKPSFNLSADIKCTNKELKNLK